MNSISSNNFFNSTENQNVQKFIMRLFLVSKAKSHHLSNTNVGGTKVLHRMVAREGFAVNAIVHVSVKIYRNKLILMLT